MSRSSLSIGALLLALLAAASAVSVGGGTTKPVLPLATGFADPWVLSGATVTDQPYADAKQTGARFVRLYVKWREVAPNRRPAGFDARNPADPAYRWNTVDAQIQKTVAQGLAPVFDVLDPPAWATVGVKGSSAKAPGVAALAEFVEAAARRYSGGFEGLPRVRYWQAWNEPNLSAYIVPQRVDGKSFSPAWYRSMVVDFANAVKSVDPTNVVVAGALAPFQNQDGIAPLEFVRDFFCLAPDLSSTCDVTLPIDVWGVHPYTIGGPTHKAELPDNLSLGDLPTLRRTLQAAIRLGHVSSKLQTWTTEFSWDTNPPDPAAVPMATHARWVAEALHVMWTNGISNVIWFGLYDQPQTKKYDSGLYFAPDASGKARPKLSLRAFRFPFVAYPTRAAAAIWGRTPTSARGTVVIEIRKRGRWSRLGTLKTSAQGVFLGSLATKGSWTHIRARFGRELSVPFSAKAPPDPPLTSAFGS